MEERSQQILAVIEELRASWEDLRGLEQRQLHLEELFKRLEERLLSLEARHGRLVSKVADHEVSLRDLKGALNELSNSNGPLRNHPLESVSPQGRPRVLKGNLR